MIRALFDAETEILDYMKDEQAWSSMFIDYEKPYVERLWRSWRAHFRISLHRIHTCHEDEPLFHPHPWPSAIRILSGVYEMGIGHGAGDSKPPVNTRVILTSGCVYEMIDPDEWHYVRPLTDTSHSVMITDLPWGRRAPRSEKPLGTLNQAQQGDLFNTCRAFYRGAILDRNGYPLHSTYF